MSNFNKSKDKIALSIKEFTLLKKSDFFLDRYSEPYILSMAICKDQIENGGIHFNSLSFPNVKVGDTIEFLGQGHLVYGPGNPGEFLAFTILFMESDDDIREAGSKIEAIAKSKAAELGIKAVMAANPTYGAALTLLKELSILVADQMKKDKDDELFRINGTILRDSTPPFDILRRYNKKNDFISAKIDILELPVSNMLGEQTKIMAL
jgi:hypothetical protein